MNIECSKMRYGDCYATAIYKGCEIRLWEDGKTEELSGKLSDYDKIKVICELEHHLADFIDGFDRHDYRY